MAITPFYAAGTLRKLRVPVNLNSPRIEKNNEVACEEVD
jgi:hypothetical protein